MGAGRAQCSHAQRLACVPCRAHIFRLVSQAEYTAQVAQQREAAELGVGSLGLSEGPAASGGSASAAAGAGSNRCVRSRASGGRGSLARACVRGKGRRGCC